MSQIIIISHNMSVVNHNVTGINYYLDAEDLPFHLCSIHIFLIIFLKFVIKKESIKQRILCFMAPTMLIGGLLALFIPTEGINFLNMQVYEYFPYHAFIIFFAIYLIKNKIIKINKRVLIENISFLTGLVFIAIWLNSMLSIYGVNFMFMARPPMEGLPILNMNHGWHIYFITIYSIGIMALFVFHLPFIISNKLKKNLIN